MSNTRIITAFIAFIATFIFSAGLVRILFGAPEYTAASYNYSRTHCFDRKARSIENFIYSDIANGEQRMDKIVRRGGYNVTPSSVYFADLADAVDEYAQTSGSMDDSQLPQDLRAEWRKHMNAWRNFADFLNETNASAARKAMSPEEFRAAERLYNKEINRTWEEVLSIGRTYGARVY